MKKILFIFVALFFFVGSIYAKKQVAVYVDCNIIGNYKELAESNMVSAIAKDKDFVLIERNKMFLSALQRELDYQLSGNVSFAQISTIGEQFGAQYVIVVTVSGLIITGKIIDVESAQVVAAENISYLGEVGRTGYGGRIKIFPELLLGAFKYPSLVDVVETKKFYSHREILIKGLEHRNENMQMISDRGVLRYLIFAYESREDSLYGGVIYDYYTEEEQIPTSRRKFNTRVTTYVHYLQWSPYSEYPEIKQDCAVFDYIDGVPEKTRQNFYIGMLVFYCPSHLVTW